MSDERSDSSQGEIGPTSTFEAWSAARLARVSQTITRRSALYRIAGVVLGSAAINVLRPVGAGAQPPGGMVGGGGFNPDLDWHNCSMWDRCGMCGYSCNCCNGGANNPEDCPNCADVGDSWMACCRNDNGVRKRVRYFDCVRGNCDNSKLQECYDCSGCDNGCDDPETGDWWKGPGQTYVCTTVRHQGDC